MPCTSLADVASGRRGVYHGFDTPDVESVLFGEMAWRRSPRLGKLLDMSTVSPVNTREMAARLADLGVEMLDAPVSGGEVGAVAGTLSIMVGGKAGALLRVRPLFDVIGSNIVLIGGNGSGQVAKACNQITVVEPLPQWLRQCCLPRKWRRSLQSPRSFVGWFRR